MTFWLFDREEDEEQPSAADEWGYVRSDMQRKRVIPILVYLKRMLKRLW